MSKSIHMIYEAAHHGDTRMLYDIMEQFGADLKQLDVPFVSTPLHIAALFDEKFEFTMNCATLMPSLMRKLNHEGQTPLHLALLSGNLKTARGLVDLEPGLIRIKGKDGKTPLHVAAGVGLPKIFAEFLLACPSSVEDLTFRKETVVHLAVQNRNLRTFEVLDRWLRTVNRDYKYILNLKNSEGDTALHIATRVNDAEMVRKLIKYVDRAAENFRGQTALDIFQEDPKDIRIRSMLYYQHLPNKKKVITELSKCFWMIVGRDIFSENSIGAVLFDWGRGLDEKSRDITLLVAVLIATAAYQGMLSPPGGFLQDDSSLAGMIMSGGARTCYLLFNSISFIMSIAVIIACMPGHVASAILIFSVTFFLMTYFTAFLNASPWKSSTGTFQALNIVVLLLLLYVLLLGWQFVLSGLSRAKEKEIDQMKMARLLDDPFKEFESHDIRSRELPEAVNDPRNSN